MTISDVGISLLKESEGFRAKPYNDVAGNATVGFGTLLHEGSVDPIIDHKYMFGISQPVGEALLRQHLLSVVYPAISGLVKVELKQRQFDALCDFTYNLGDGALAGSTLLKKLNAGDYDPIPSELVKWCKARVDGEMKTIDGLLTRRKREAKLWTTGDWR